MQISANTLAAKNLFHDGIQALSRASIRGMRIDVQYCKKQQRYLEKKVLKLEKKFLKSTVGKEWKKVYFKPNINSDAQLRDVLFKRLKIKPVKTTAPSKMFPEGQASVDNESLELLSKNVEELKDFVNYRKFNKDKNTYIDGLLKEQVDGFLHPFFHLDRARTFRSSSSNINFQNQPNRDEKQKRIVRSAFIPRSGNCLMAADFKGIEVGVSACYHKDPKMIRYVSDPKSDMHGDMAIQCYSLDEFKKTGTEKVLRKGAKNGFVFPQFYGDYFGNNAPVLCNWGHLPTNGVFRKNDGLKLMTGQHLGLHLMNKGIDTYDDFVQHIKEVENHFWNKRFKKYSEWKKKNVEEYYEKGYLNLLTGFTCSGIMSKNDINNYPIQGSAFHCLLLTFIEVDRILTERKFKSKLIGQIHDELVFDAAPKEIDDILEIIRNTVCLWLPRYWKWIIIPLEVEANIFEPDMSWASKSSEVKLAA